MDRPRMCCWVALAGGLAAAGGTDIQPKPGDGSQDHVKARLVAQDTQLNVGERLIGVTFDIDPGWHVYWDGLNDSGLPLSVKFNLPQGYAAGTMRWPVPKRHVAAGDILDHVYEGRITLVLPVAVPTSAEYGKQAKITADVEWFACKDVCLRGGTKLELVLPQGGLSVADPPQSKDAPLFAGPYPEPKPPDWISTSWSGRTVTFAATPKEGAAVTKLVFCPFRDCAEPVDLLKQGEVAGSSLALDIKSAGKGAASLGGASGGAGSGNRVRGILEVFRGGSRLPVESFTIDTPVPTGPGS